MKQHYLVNLQCRIMAADKNGNPTGYGSGGLEVSETITILADDFLELCKILGQIHEQAQKIKLERGIR